MQMHRDDQNLFQIDSKIVIFACQSMAEEIKAVAESIGVPYDIQVCRSQCHQQPGNMLRSLDESIKKLKNFTNVFIGYGECVPLPSITARKNHYIYRVNTPNCAAALIGEPSKYKRYSDRNFFLTPHLALHWKEYLAGKKEDAPISELCRLRLAKWFRSIEKLIMIDTAVPCEKDAVNNAIELSELIKKPLKIIQADLSFLSREYRDFCLGK